MGVRGAFPAIGKWEPGDCDSPGSVSGENQGLEGKDERLQPQDQGMHQRDRVDHMQEQPAPGANVGIGEEIVVVGVGVGDAQASRRDIREPALVQRLEEDSQRARSSRLLRIDQNVDRKSVV